MVPLPIAHYKIKSKLGEGGMGEVYRATDTKLGRDVAIKVIPDVLPRDADRLARFARETQVLAALNHPNIAAIYGVEESALVLELVQGPPLGNARSKGRSRWNGRRPSPGRSPRRWNMRTSGALASAD
jgi:serine/threonine protein kinase